MTEEEKSRQRIKEAAYKAEAQQHPGERGDDYFKERHKPDAEGLKRIWRIDEAIRACWRI